MGNKASLWFIEYSMVSYCKTDYTTEIRLVEIALGRKLSKGNSPIQRYFGGDFEFVDCLKASSIILIKSAEVSSICPLAPDNTHLCRTYTWSQAHMRTFKKIKKFHTLAYSCLACVFHIF